MMGEHTIHYSMLLMPGNGQLTRGVFAMKYVTSLKMHTIVFIF